MRFAAVYHCRAVPPESQIVAVVALFDGVSEVKPVETVQVEFVMVSAPRKLDQSIV